MNKKLLPLLITIPLLVTALIFLSRGLLTTTTTPATEPASAPNAVVASGSAATSASSAISADTAVTAVEPVGEQEYPQAINAVIDQYRQWRAGPIAQRAEAMETKMENAGALSNLTYGNLLLLYLKAQSSGRSDMSMDWIIFETVAPKLQPIYEEIVVSGAALATFLNGSTPPADLADQHNILAGCINGEVSRSQEMIEVFSGNRTATVPERMSDPCTQVEPAIEQIQAYVRGN
jgi:hypothetical protein